MHGGKRHVIKPSNEQCEIHKNSLTETSKYLLITHHNYDKFQEIPKDLQDKMSYFLFKVFFCRLRQICF